MRVSEVYIKKTFVIQVEAFGKVVPFWLPLWTQLSQFLQSDFLLVSF